MVDSPFNEDSFSREALILEEGQLENLGKMGNDRDIYCYAKSGLVDFEREYQFLPPWYQIASDASTFIHARPNFR